MKTTETKSVVLLHQHPKALRLPTVTAECVKVVTQADGIDLFRPRSVAIERSNLHAMAEQANRITSTKQCCMKQDHLCP
jgi:hypothetical protein